MKKYLVFMFFVLLMLGLFVACSDSVDSKPTSTVSFDVQGHGTTPTSQAVKEGEKVKRVSPPPYGNRICV